MAYEKKWNYKTNEEKVDFRQELTDAIIVRMEDALEYKKPWFELKEDPFNRQSGRSYTGLNRIKLAFAGYSDPRFLTFHQIQEAAEKDGVSYSVKGQKATIIQGFFTPNDKSSSTIDNSSNDVASKSEASESDEVKSKGKWKRPKPIAVFNCSQIANFPKYHIQEKEFEDYEPAEILIEAMREKGLKFEHHAQGRAYYIPSKDEVWLPHKDLFKSEGDYYRTAMHEIGHATGSSTRLDRDQTGAMRTSDEKSFALYAYEELVAELTSYIVGAELGIPYSSSAHENHGAYMKHWLGALKDKKTGAQYFSDAIEDAGKASDLVIGYLNEKIMSMEKEKEIEQTKEVAIEPVVQFKKEEEKHVIPLPGKKPAASKSVALAR